MKLEEMNLILPFSKMENTTFKCSCSSRFQNVKGPYEFNSHSVHGFSELTPVLTQPPSHILKELLQD
jgi:hypothetical protein